MLSTVVFYFVDILLSSLQDKRLLLSSLSVRVVLVFNKSELICKINGETIERAKQSNVGAHLCRTSSQIGIEFGYQP